MRRPINKLGFYKACNLLYSKLMLLYIGHSQTILLVITASYEEKLVQKVYELMVQGKISITKVKIKR